MSIEHHNLFAIGKELHWCTCKCISNVYAARQKLTIRTKLILNNVFFKEINKNSMKKRRNLRSCVDTEI